MVILFLSSNSAERPPGKDKAALAAQSFNVPEVPGKMSGWISGFVELPPEVILFYSYFYFSSAQWGVYLHIYVY